ncbi:DUF6087 family protein [Kitasatospora sp. NPDC059722]|uniref:DUF6087 family protein n=1 Tax=Kitasatospora sp. NPDC059722 TaxID=3346925 RepID=UPI0036BD0655
MSLSDRSCQVNASESARPLSEWYADRADRDRPPGTRDALVLIPEDRQELHPFQDLQRLVVEWDGRAWRPVAVAADFSEAYPLIMRRNGELIEAQEDTPVALLRKGAGRHRRPVPPPG